MGWWWRKDEKEKYAVCAECRVHFEPYKGHYLGDVVEFSEYCSAHRAPKLEAKRREDDLVRWTKDHLDLVEKVKAKEDKKEAAQRKKAQVDAPSGLGLINHGYSSLAAQQDMAYTVWNSAFGSYGR